MRSTVSILVLVRSRGIYYLGRRIHRGTLHVRLMYEYVRIQEASAETVRSEDITKLPSAVAQQRAHQPERCSA